MGGGTGTGWALEEGIEVYLMHSSPSFISSDHSQLVNSERTRVRANKLESRDYDLIAHMDDSEARHSRLNKDQLMEAVRLYIKDDEKANIYVAPSASRRSILKHELAKLNTPLVNMPLCEEPRFIPSERISKPTLLPSLGFADGAIAVPRNSSRITYWGGAD